MNCVSKQKTAHLAAFFLKQSQGEMYILKLVKLMYLAERKHLSKFMRTITRDHFVSMPHGPVPTSLYETIQGCLDSGEWDKLISDRKEHKVSLKTLKQGFDFDELSDIELETAESVWKEFGHMGRFEIRDWTHDNCPEWEDPQGSSNPISYERILKFAAGMEDAEAKETAEEIERLQQATIYA